MKQRGRTFCVRLTPAEYDWLSKRAEAAGLSRSEWARRVLGGVTLGQPVAGHVETLKRLVDKACFLRRQVWRCCGGAKHDLLVAPVDAVRPDECPLCEAEGTLEDVGVIGVASSVS